MLIAPPPVNTYQRGADLASRWGFSPTGALNVEKKYLMTAECVLQEPSD